MTKKINQMAVRYRSLADGDDVAFKWESSLNKILTPGNYAVKIEHYGADVGLPIEGCGAEHSIVGTLVVTDSGAVENKQSDRVMGQVLTFTLRASKETSIYTRTYAAGEWGTWHGLAHTGMYDEINNADTLYSTVTSLVSTTKEIEDCLHGSIINYNEWKNSDAELSLPNVLADDEFVKMVKSGAILTFKSTSTTWKRFQYTAESTAAADVRNYSNWKELSGALYGIKQAVDAGKVQISTTGENGDIKNILNVAAATTERAGVMSAEDKKEQVKKSALIKGDIVVGQAKEIYSRIGKTDVATFIKRTTAKTTSISDGIAFVKQIGGYTIKNMVDGTFAIGWAGGLKLSNNIGFAQPASGFGGFSYSLTPEKDHKYYISCYVNRKSNEGVVYLRYGYGQTSSTTTSGWVHLSRISVNPETYIRVEIICGTVPAEFYATQPLCIDLTEMFGAGNEPTLGECDAIFGNMPALPLGINVAQPATFKSVGYNQCDVSKALQNKTVANGAISNGKNYLVPMPCVPCKIGTGENNGYVISTGEGDAWSEEAITAVYYTPLNPIEVTGELYLQKLGPQICEQCNGGHNVYVPSCAGWLLIETTSIDKLCAHFAWSGDRLYTDYEPYEESVIELPSIPEMSDWGLATVFSNGTMINDVVDLERYCYIKRVGKDADGNFIALATPEEYPIALRKAPAYIANDYGTEEFVGSTVPLSGNKLFYQRSLVSELRNFLDRLYNNLTVSDACAVADKLAAFVQQIDTSSSIEDGV